MEKTFILGIKINIPEFQFSDEVNEEERKQFIKDYTNRLWYYKIYMALIAKCQKMEAEGYSDDVYTEKHHILPKCMFPENTDKKIINDKSNLVRMPVRYHIMAHILLFFIYPDDFSLVYAASIMVNTKIRKSQYKNRNNIIIISTRLVSKIKSDRSRLMLGRQLSDETKKLLSELKKRNKNPMFGKKLSEEQKKIISEANKNKIVSESTRRKLSKIHKGKLVSIKTRQKLREIALARPPRSEEVKKKISEHSAFSKKIVGPDNTVYNSYADCSRKTGIPESTLKYWTGHKPEKGFKLLKSEN